MLELKFGLEIYEFVNIDFLIVIRNRDVSLEWVEFQDFLPEVNK
jgi:hypothetical protein